MACCAGCCSCCGLMVLTLASACRLLACRARLQNRSLKTVEEGMWRCGVFYGDAGKGNWSDACQRHSAACQQHFAPQSLECQPCCPSCLPRRANPAKKARATLQRSRCFCTRSKCFGDPETVVEFVAGFMTSTKWSKMPLFLYPHLKDFLSCFVNEGFHVMPS